jgi:excisionase family DNA binding protein
MASQHLFSTKSGRGRTPSARLGRSRLCAAGLAHLLVMETTTHPETPLSPVVTLSQLADQLGVSVQTLYDLRSQGRGPRGFRVGRELRFRVSEVDAWLAQLEADDAERHPRRAG